jgi:hypothetical protein
MNIDTKKNEVSQHKRRRVKKTELLKIIFGYTTAQK